MQETEQDVIFQAIKFGSASLDKSSFSLPYGYTLRDEEMKNIIEYLNSLI